MFRWVIGEEFLERWGRSVRSVVSAMALMNIPSNPLGFAAWTVGDTGAHQKAASLSRVARQENGESRVHSDKQRHLSLRQAKLPKSRI